MIRWPAFNGWDRKQGGGGENENWSQVALCPQSTQGPRQQTSRKRESKKKKESRVHNKTLPTPNIFLHWFGPLFLKVREEDYQTLIPPGNKSYYVLISIQASLQYTGSQVGEPVEGAGQPPETAPTAVPLIWDIWSKTPTGCLKPQISPNSTYTAFFLYICIFSLKRSFYNFSLAYLNSQHHYPCTLGPLLSKLRVTWTQARRYSSSRSDNWWGY